MSSVAKRLHVITWGCQMNVYDSGRMADVLAPLGYAPTSSPDDADMVILNTCHIRERAVEKVFSELGRLRVVKQARELAGQRTILAVAGCVAQAEGAEILARAPYVDIVLGPQTYHRLPEMVARASRAGGAVIETDFSPEDKFDHLPEASSAPGVTAFLTIQEGCDKFCSFCVVPYTRGVETSRPVAGVLGGGAAAGGGRGAGDHAAGAERECLSWDGRVLAATHPRPLPGREGGRDLGSGAVGAGFGGDTGIVADPVYDEPSAGHG